MDEQVVSMRDRDGLGRLLDGSRSLVAEREVAGVLERLLALARELTAARYVAIEFDGRRERLGDFVAHPMRTFLRVPIVTGGEAWGHLCLIEKEGGGAFDEADEESAVVLASWAAIAVENARPDRAERDRRAELERSSCALEATAEIATAVTREMRLEAVLELIAKRAPALVQASAVAVLLVDAEEFEVAAAAGQIPREIVGLRLPKSASIFVPVLASRRTGRIGDLDGQLDFPLRDAGVDARAGLFAPLRLRGTYVGVIAAFDRIDGPEFGADDELLLQAAAATAAAAVATAQSVERHRLKKALRAAEDERRRSARELHDQTLEVLDALRVQLGNAERKGDLAYWQQTGREAIAEIQREIANLRAIITELHPPSFDEFGLAPALEALVRRARTPNGVGTAKREISLQEGVAWWSDAAVGTNALSTAVALDHPVQILSTEHVAEAVHPWTVWPRRRGPARPSRVRLHLLGHDASVQVSSGRRERGLRSLELLAVLAMHPEGMTSEQLALALYGECGKAVTIRAQVHRVRAYLGEASVDTHPYRLNVPVEADWLEVGRLVAAGQPREALRAYRGPLLAASDAPEIVEARALLEESLRRSILTTGDPELLSAWLAHPSGVHDLAAARALVAVLPPGDPRRAAATATAAAIARRLSQPSG